MKHLLWPEGAPLAQGNTAEDQPALTPYLVDSEQPSPAVIVLPGGGYGHRAAHEGEPIALWLNTLGVSAFVLDYRIAPYQHPTPLSDAQRAIRYVRCHAEDFRVDPGRIGILGFSAGGHLAATAGTHYDGGLADAADPVERHACRPDVLILCYPVISFGEYRHHGSMVNLIGEQPDEELRRNLSNEFQVTADTPPTFLWHTAEDGAVPVENSLMFASALSRHGVPFDLHVYERGHHGLGLAEQEPESRTWPQICGLWLAKHGFHG